MTITNDEAGSVAPLSGQEDAKAASPAPSYSSIDNLMPAATQAEEEPVDMVEGGVNLKEGPESDPIDGADLLERARSFSERFIRLPSRAASVAATLWAAHAHFMQAWDSTPRLAFLSPDPGSGKTRAMEITALLVPRALLSANASTASLIRALNGPEGRPTFLIDEADAKFGPKAKGDEDLRSMINAGYRRSGYFLRCEAVGETWIPVKLSAYAAIAVAGIGDLPDTILTRSVIISMRKRAPGEEVEPYRQRDHEHLGHSLRDELAAWAESIADRAAAHRPVLPEGIVDRNADVWEPLIAVADLAGGQWPDMAREAALELLASAKSGAEPSLGVRLLSDIHRCFRDEDQIPTAELLVRLLADEEAPWGDLRGKKLNPRELGGLLKPYGISSQGLRLPNGSTPKGYKREAFYDAWIRYPPVSV